MLSFEFLKSCPESPGVYQMISVSGEVLYVGKAINLKKRLQSYSNFDSLSSRIQMMISIAEKVKLIETSCEIEALLLETSLIKSIQPRFNVLMKDGKEFAKILLSDSNYPRILRYRGNPKCTGESFGPFISVSDVDLVIDFISKVFKLRTCSDTVFTSRKRPCLQYFIGRCSAPCVGLISKESYSRDVMSVKMLLTGKNKSLLARVKKRMKEASSNEDFETAAILRDQLVAIGKIQSHTALKNKGS